MNIVMYYIWPSEVTVIHYLNRLKTSFESPKDKNSRNLLSYLLNLRVINNQITVKLQSHESNLK